MNTLYVDAGITDDDRREALYAGQLFAYAPTRASTAFVEFARSLIREAFGALDPETAQYEMPVEDYAAVLAELKPTFIHHPESKTLIEALLEDFGCDLDKTYFDVPRMRTATSDDFLTTGIAYAFHPHRDTWYSAPQCQLNWWLPIYDIESDRSMAFHPRYSTSRSRTARALTTTTSGTRRVASTRRSTSRRIRESNRDPSRRSSSSRRSGSCPRAAAYSSSQQPTFIRPSPTQQGKTRFSIDFRTVHEDDVETFRGAANIDSACTGTTLGDYLRARDKASLPPGLVSAYDRGPQELRDRLTSPVLT